MVFVELPPIEWEAPDANELAVYKMAAERHKVMNQAPNRVSVKVAAYDEQEVIEANWLLPN